MNLSLNYVNLLSMEQPAINILGVYNVEMTDDLFRQAMDIKYGDIALSEQEKSCAEDEVRQELASVVLIEALITPVDSRFNVGDFTQPGSDQAAYDEVFLSLDGQSRLPDPPASKPKAVRVAFFLHYVDPDQPLLTSYGSVPLPPSEKMPARLKSMVPYEPVD